MASFVNRRPSPSAYESLVVPFVCTRGQAVGFDLTTNDGSTAVKAGGTNFVGFVARNVTADGPSLSDHVYPGRLDLAEKAGNNVSIEMSDEADVGSEFLRESGTGGLSTATAVGTPLSFLGNTGLLRVAQSGDVVYYTLAAQLTPETGETCRIRIVKT